MRLVSTAVLALLICGSPLAAQQAPAAPTAEQIRAAERALGTVDEERVDRDPAYAGTIADHLLVLQARPGLDAETRLRQQTALAVILSAAGRHDAADAAADALIRMQPGEAFSYRLALSIAGRAEHFSRFATIIGAAADGVTDPEQRAALHAALPAEYVYSMLSALRDDPDARARLAAQFLRLGWPGESEAATRGDDLRMLVLERQVARGETAGAAELAAQVRGLGSVLALVTGLRFDPFTGEGDRLARVRAAIDADDRATATALAAAPEDTAPLVERAAFLRSVGRDRDVLALLMPLMADPALVVARGDRGLWLVNEAAYSLIATGEVREGIELMRPLTTMDLAERPELVNTSINFVSMLRETGQTEEALRAAEALATTLASDRGTTDYGRMIIWETAACAAAELGRRPASDAWLQRMTPKANENPQALIEASLCRGEADAAERVLIDALASERWRDQAVLWMQDWAPAAQTPLRQRMRERFAVLRARPAVEAAFARVGRRLRMPLPARTYGY